MKRPQKIGRIYQELRATLGNEYPAHELLRSAAKLVEIVEDDFAASGADVYEPRATVDERPLDMAIADGGWKVLARESAWLQRIDGDDTQSNRTKMRLRNYGLEMAA